MAVSAPGRIIQNLLIGPEAGALEDEAVVEAAVEAAVVVEDRRSPDVSISMDFHGGSHVHGSRDYGLCHTRESVGRGAP